MLLVLGSLQRIGRHHRSRWLVNDSFAWDSIAVCWTSRPGVGSLGVHDIGGASAAVSGDRRVETITDGAYAGFRGKLVLVGWERMTDDANRLIEVAFQPTRVEFSPA